MKNLISLMEKPLGVREEQERGNTSSVDDSLALAENCRKVLEDLKAAHE